jgi:hypothetical protein
MVVAHLLLERQFVMIILTEMILLKIRLDREMSLRSYRTSLELVRTSFIRAVSLMIRHYTNPKHTYLCMCIYWKFDTEVAKKLSTFVKLEGL